ncbi:MAG: LpxI family protein, partial [Selenomonadaceae bacterium]|nr:LpxI family protein [Selenomonadaceae bacterium]
RKLMPHRGTITKREPTAKEKQDMEFGFRMAKEIGRLDVGQTAVVKDLAVMALEAIEGTDACIQRGGALANGGAVIAKVAKPQQDNRFDVPTVGLKTIETMVSVKASALAIEADKTLLVEREKVLALAEANDITIVAM